MASTGISSEFQRRVSRTTTVDRIGLVTYGRPPRPQSCAWCHWEYQEVLSVRAPSILGVSGGGVPGLRCRGGRDAASLCGLIARSWSRCGTCTPDFDEGDQLADGLVARVGGSCAGVDGSPRTTERVAEWAGGSRLAGLRSPATGVGVDG
jgi:hypothetical protein